MNYNEKFQKIKSSSSNSLFEHLANSDLKTFIERFAFKYQFSLQEFREFTIMIVDLYMWNMFDLQKEKIEKLYTSISYQNKKNFFCQIRKDYEQVRAQEKSYTNTNFADNSKNTKITIHEQNKIKVRDSGSKIYGMCPVASEKTICCNLRTIDVVHNCPFACSYCSIQTFYNKKDISIENNLAKKLELINSSLENDKDRLYHFGIGQSSDALAIGNHENILSTLFSWAGVPSNTNKFFLELKTKSNNISYIKKCVQNKTLPPNIVVSWTINTSTIIKHEELLTASLDERLHAARQIADLGVPIAFHFHPIVYYQNWEKEYQEAIEKILKTFLPQEIVFISLGTVTFIRPVIQEIRLLGAKDLLKSKILQMPLTEINNRFSYPFFIKEKLFTHIYKSFNQWHDNVFFYLCMEPAECWRFECFKTKIFQSFKCNEDFEKSLCENVFRKLKIK